MTTTATNGNTKSFSIRRRHCAINFASLEFYGFLFKFCCLMVIKYLQLASTALLECSSVTREEIDSVLRHSATWKNYCHEEKCFIVGKQ